MRLARLDLTRYGKFTDKSLSFPKSDCDLHLIVGPNEAGKSTIRQAILDLFYGIAKSSPYSFMHGLPEMVVGGVLDDADGPLEFRRLKKTKNPLANAAGEPFPEGELTKRLGGTDARFFKRMFGLDHPTLVEGGTEILNSAGDVGQMLFQAAAGVASLHHVRTKLEEEARALWGDRKRGEAAYYIALKHFTDAESRLKEVGVSSSKWLTAKRALDGAVAEADAALKEYRALEARRERLERIRRVAGPLQQMRDAIAERDRIGSPPLLPDNAAATLAAAENEIALAKAKREFHQRRLDTDTSELDKIMINEALLEHETEIKGVAGRVASFLQASEDLPVVQGQIDAKTGTVLALAKQIGWGETTIREIEAKLPTRLVRAEVEALLRTQEAIAKEAQRADKDHKDKIAEVDGLDARIKAVPPVAVSPALEAAIKAARALDFDGRSAEAQVGVSASQEKLEAALTVLIPWTGDLSGLRSLDVPQHDEIRRFANDHKTLETRRNIATEELRTRRLSLADAETEARQYQRQRQPVTEQALRERRGQRDALWQSLRSGAGSLASRGDEYETEVKATDDLADRRYLDAATTEHAQTLVNKVERLLAEIDERDRQVNEANAALAELDLAWQARMVSLGLSGLTLDRIGPWSQNRDKTLAAGQKLDDAKTQLATLRARAKGQQQALRTVLTELGVTGLESADLNALIAYAEGATKGHTEYTGKLQNLQQQRDEAAFALPLLAKQAEVAGEAQHSWTASWTRQIAASSLPANIGAAGAAKALPLFGEMEEACREMRDQRKSRTDPMQQEINRFTTDACSLAGKCAPELVEEAPVGIAARLGELLRQTQQADDRRAHLAKAIVKTREEHDRAVQEETLAAAKIKPLLDAAQVATADELRAAIAVSDAYRGADQRVRDARDAAMNGGDGLPFERLETEVASEDLTQIEAILLEVRNARDTAQARRDQCIERRTQAQDEFSKIAGQDDAAKAESKRQDALLGMGEAVDEYVRITIGAKLLKWAVDRYREDKQEPLLKRASELFAQLTLGEYPKLAVDYEADPVTLTARKADGTLVAITGLSTGTEDQLYLALRLAALELHLVSATPMPFIADDIFINWDDDRASAGFGALAQLATKAQVIVLLHHTHLIEVARKATDGCMRVIEL